MVQATMTVLNLKELLGVKGKEACVKGPPPP